MENNMNTKLSEMSYYMEPEVYVGDRPDDNTGPETRTIVEKMMGVGPSDIFHD